MYIESEDYETIWSLAHKWIGFDPDTTYPENLPPEVLLYIQRIAAAVFREQLPARNKKRAIFIDDSTLSFIIDLPHFRKLKAFIFNGVLDKNYLNSIYVKRANVIDWCLKEYLEVPNFWQTKTQSVLSNLSYDTSDDENEGWYNDLTERRKQRVACLEMAKKLWTINSSQSYEQIYNDPVMKQFGNPNVFSLDAFKKWARPFAPEQVKEGGRPIKNK